MKIKEHEGKWDEALAAFIILSPFLTTIGFLVFGISTGMITVGDVTVTGNIPIQPLVYGMSGLLGLTYFLALAKVFGIKPIKWIANTARNYK